VLETAVEVAMATAREASGLLCAHLQAPLTIHRKGVRDLVTDADLAAQALIVERLQASFPDHAIWAEEGDAAMAGAGADHTWIVDPLDGTTATVAIFRLPFSACPAGASNWPGIGTTWQALSSSCGHLMKGRRGEDGEGKG